MIEIKSNFSGGLNLDDALYNVPKNSYIDAVNVTRDAIEGSNDEAFTNIVGNQGINFPRITSVTSDLGSHIKRTFVTFTPLFFYPGSNILVTINSGASVITLANYTSTFGQTPQQVLAAVYALFPAGIGLTYGLDEIGFAITYNDNTYSNVQVTVTENIGEKVCIGAYPNNVRNTVIYFVWIESGYHSVLEYDNYSRTVYPVFINLVDSDNVDILGFTKLDKITSINIYNRNIADGEGDLLFFLDSLGRPTTMDILRFKNQEYTPVTRDVIDVAKCPPLFPPSCLYGNDTTRNSNSLRNRLFRFKYRYVYDNNQKSTCSPISEVPLPLNILQDTYTNVNTNNNKIDLAFYTGDKEVKAVELLMSYVNKTNDWSDFSIIDTINKAQINLLSINLTNTPAIFYPGNNNAAFQFIGDIVPGIQIVLTMTKISPASIIPLASYTTVFGDTIDSIINSLYTQILTVVEKTYVNKSGNTINVGYNTTLYRISSSNIIIAYPNSSNSSDNIYYQYSFYNDGVYPTLDINESIQLFDYVPTKANAQEMPNGNVLMYGGITEGYDRDLVPNVVNTVLTKETNAIIPGNFQIVAVTNDNNFPWAIFGLGFSGTPIPGTTIQIYVKNPSNVSFLVCSYLTVAGDTAITVTNNICALLVASTTYIQFALASGNTITAECKLASGGGFLYIFDKYVLTPPSVLSQSLNSIPTFLFSTQRKLGIAYFDKKGKTNGILYSGNISMPSYAENAGHTAVLLPYINTKIYHQPPEWAYSYGFYLTKEDTQFLYWQAKIVYSDTDFYYFDISNLPAYQKSSPTVTNVLNYTFQDGDRLRLIKNVLLGTVYNDTYDAAIEGQVIDPTISGTARVGTFIKIKKFSPFTGITYSTDSFIIQLYRPIQQQPSGTNTVYYEFGQQYPIGLPETDNRYHIGMVSNQVLNTSTPAEFNFYKGDVYFRIRNWSFTSPSGADTAAFNVLDRNFVDNYISAVNSVDGRSSVIDINARKAYYSTLVRFSEAYQPDTNINGTNRFYPNNFDEYDYTYGDIMRFKVRDRFVRVFQKLKVGQVPLYHQILKEQNKESLVVTDRLLNPIQYYVGDVGIGDNAESLASYNFADYFTSNIKGVICRVSNDGIKFLSIDHKIDSWAWKAISQRFGYYKIYGAFDQILQQYVIALEATTTDEAHTLIFGEGENTFDTYLSYYPEMMTTLGVLFITFKNGKLYTHDSTIYNNFYGQQYDSSVTLVFNDAPLDKKTFLAIGEVASQIWDVPEMKTDINSIGTTKMTSNLVDSDFATLEGTYEATILRDQNSIGGLVNGDTMKGKVLTVTFRAKNPTSLVSLNLLSLKYINSPLNNR